MQVRRPRPWACSRARGCLPAILGLATYQAQPRWLGGFGGLPPPCYRPNCKHRVGCPHALPGSRCPSRDPPTPVHKEPRPREASLPDHSSPAPLCRHAPRGSGSPGIQLSASASSADNSSEGQLMSKVAPFPTRLSPSTCPLQCAAARQRHSREPFGPTHLLLMA